MTDSSEQPNFASFNWMPSRVPIHDARVTAIAKGERAPQLPYYAARSRWYLQQAGSSEYMPPYHEQQIDQSQFRVERGGWQHADRDERGLLLAAMRPPNNRVK